MASQDWVYYELLRKQDDCRDTVRLTFAANDGVDMRAALDGKGSHLDCAASIGGEVVVRPYTPFIFPNVQKKGALRHDTFELVVKSYERGKLSKHIAGLKVGQSLAMCGPYGGVVLDIIPKTGRQSQSWASSMAASMRGADGAAPWARKAALAAPKQSKVKAIGMIAGGTGITPMLQIIYHTLAQASESACDPSSLPQMYIVFANREKHDIVCLKEVLQLSVHPNIHVHLILTREEAGVGVPGLVEGGGVSCSMGAFRSQWRALQQHLPAPPSPTDSGSVKMVVCGPPGFHRTVRGMLTEGVAAEGTEEGRPRAGHLGYPTACLHEFLGESDASKGAGVGAVVGAGVGTLDIDDGAGEVAVTTTTAGAAGVAEGKPKRFGTSGSLSGSATIAYAGAGAGAGASASEGAKPALLVARSLDLPEGERRHVEVHGRHVTVFRHSGSLFCMDSICYHAGGPLTIGDIEEVGGHDCVVCPWHTYHVRLDTGERMYRGLKPVGGKLVPTGWECAGKRQRVHAVEERADGVYVTLDEGDEEWESDEYAYDPRYTGNLRAGGGSSRPDPSGNGGGGGGGGGKYRGTGGFKRSGHVLQQNRSDTSGSIGKGSAGGLLRNYRGKY